MPTLEALLIEYKGDGRDNSDSIDGCIYAGSVCGNHAGSVSCGDLKFDQCFITLLLSKTEIPPTGWMDSWRYFWPAKEVKVMWKNRGGGSLTGLGQIRFQCMITLIDEQHRGGDVPIWRWIDQETGQGKGKRISVDGEKECYCCLTARCRDISNKDCANITIKCCILRKEIFLFTNKACIIKLQNMPDGTEISKKEKTLCISMTQILMLGVEILFLILSSQSVNVKLKWTRN